MTDVCQTCSHPQERHVLDFGFCTFNTKNEPGLPWNACQCTAFVARSEIRRRVPEDVEDFAEEGWSLADHHEEARESEDRAAAKEAAREQT